MSTALELPSREEQEHFHQIGIETDTLGRPLHPWREQLPGLTDGHGFYWQWGPNYTVDPIIITREETPRILLIRRGDNGKWALPGGFIDDQEPPKSAGLRELKEETNLALPNSEPVICYQGPVLDERSRLHAWSDTTALLWRLDEAAPVHAGDDAQDAKWFELKDVHSLENLHGSHATLIDMAIRDHGSLHDQLEYFGELNEVVQPRGGHMGYTRFIATTPSGRRIFVKRHDAQKFTDDVRAEHSRRYLRKEHHVYQQLQGVTPHVPEHIELKGDHTLILDAYDPRDGWHWKAPRGAELQRRYIEDVLDALHSLESVEFMPFEEIRASYETIVDEGWGEYSNQRQLIITKLMSSSIAGAQGLADALDTLHAQHFDTTTPSLTHFAHYDIRQSNIAWHPDHGVRIVDWSWADQAPRGMDVTSFVVDLAKAGYDVDTFLPQAVREHLVVLIGFWLGHSVWPTPTADQTVREHQVGSAVAAYDLLKRLPE